MTEILSRGGEPPPRRRGWIAGVAAVALLAGGSAYSLLRPDGEPDAGRMPASHSPVPVPGALPPTGAPVADPDPVPIGPPPARDLDGEPLRQATGLTALLWDDAAVPYDVDARRAGRALLAAGAAGGPTGPRAGTGVRVLLPVTGGTLALRTDGGALPATAAVWLLRSGQPARRVGEAGALLPALDPATAWFVRHDGGRTVAQRHDATGRPRGRRLTLAPGSFAVGESAYGLLVQQPDPVAAPPPHPPLRHELVDVRTGQRTPVDLPPVIAVTRTAAVTLGGRDPARMSVERRHLGTGRMRSVHLPRGVELATLAPDGNRLALFVSPRREESTLYELDVAAMRLRHHPRVVLPGHTPYRWAWSPDSRWLVLHVATSSGPVLGLWRAGAERMAKLRLDVAADALAVVSAPTVRDPQPD